MPSKELRLCKHVLTLLSMCQNEPAQAFTCEIPLNILGNLANFVTDLLSFKPDFFAVIRNPGIQLAMSRNILNSDRLKWWHISCLTNACRTGNPLLTPSFSVREARLESIYMDKKEYDPLLYSKI